MRGRTDAQRGSAVARHVESADGTPIACRASGSGDPLVLVHGTATSSADWAFALPFLRERFTVVTMDRRGRGRSGDAASHSIAREAEDIAAVLDAVGAELLVAHSYGALCAMELAASGRDLRRLLLYEPPIAVRAERAEALSAMVDAGDLEGALSSFLLGAGTPREQFDLIRHSPAWPVLLDTVPTVPRELRAAAAWRHPLRTVDVATAFVLGADTRGGAFLEGLDGLRARFPGSRLELIAGQQHTAHVFAAEAFADLVTGFCAS